MLGKTKSSGEHEVAVLSWTQTGTRQLSLLEMSGLSLTVMVGWLDYHLW